MSDDDIAIPRTEKFRHEGLKACPFCENKAVATYGAHGGSLAIRCTDCKGSTRSIEFPETFGGPWKKIWEFMRDEAALLWNMRDEDNARARANSYKTAITRKRLSAPTRFLQEKGLLVGKVLDYGCGKGTDAFLLGADKYDPHFFPEEPKRLYDTIICIYVLNTVPPADTDRIVYKIRSLLKKGGIAYLAVRNDAKLGFTKRGTLQHCSRPPGKLLKWYKNRFAIYGVTAHETD